MKRANIYPVVLLIGMLCSVSFGFERFPYDSSTAGAPSIAIVSQGMTVYTNPATLAKVQQKTVSFEEGRLYAGVIPGHTLQYLQPVGRLGTIGINLSSLSANDVRYETNSIIFGTSLKTINIGVKVNQYKVLEQPKIQRAVGYSADFGALVNLGQYLRVGMIAQDVGSYLKWKGDGTGQPAKEKGSMKVRMGFGLNLSDASQIGADYKENGKFAIGVDMRPTEFFGIRFGMDENSPTFGFSLKVSKLFGIDYAYNGSQLGDVQFISTHVSF